MSIIGKIIASVECDGGLLVFTDGSGYEIDVARDGEVREVNATRIAEIRAHMLHMNKVNDIMERMWKDHNITKHDSSGKLSEPIGYGGFFRPKDGPAHVSPEEIEFMKANRP